MKIETQHALKPNKIAECLYRIGTRPYFALIKVRGKQIKRSLNTVDLALAKRRLSEMRSKTARLHGNDNRNIRFEELAAQWLESVKPSLKPKSFDRRRVAIVGLSKSFEGTPIRTLGFSEIDIWKRKRGDVLSPRSHNIELETMSIIFRYACKRGILMDNPAEDFERRRQHKAEMKAPKRLEFSALVKELRGAPRAVASGAADMVEFLAYSGMRVGEAREVQFRDVNFELKSVRITGGELGTKNHEERTIPLFPNLEAVINRIKAACPINDSNARLFNIISPRGAMILACKRAGLPDFNVHSLRHFFATNAIEEGINFRVISEWLGHSDGGILVARTYGHLRAEFSAEMALKMSFAAIPDEADVT